MGGNMKKSKALNVLVMLTTSGVVMFGGYGCRNHIEYVEDTKTEYRKTELEPLYVVTTPNTTPAESLVTFKVDKHQRASTDVIQIKSVSELYTPYQGWREIYEVPTGLVLFPVAIVSHVFCAVTFAMFPFRYAVFLTNFSFSCMNPALNAEMPSRSVLELVEVIETKSGTTSENETLPAAKQPILLKSNANIWQIATDDKGEAEFHFLGLTEGSKMLSDNDREISVFVGNAKEPQVKLIISRDLLRRLEKGYEYLQEYRKAPSGDKLASTIAKLEEIKFIKLAYQLEKSELEANKDNTEFINSFKRN